MPAPSHGWVHAEDCECIRGRLVAVRLPPDKAEEARERLRREQGHELTQESLTMADFVVVFTSVPTSALSAERVLELYGLMWQVELHIKRDKSIAGLDRLPNRRPDTVYTWICAKLLLMQITRKMTSSRMTIPPSGLWSQLLAGGRIQSPGTPKIRSSGEPTSGRAGRQRTMAADDVHVASRLLFSLPC